MKKQIMTTAALLAIVMTGWTIAEQGQSGSTAQQSGQTGQSAQRSSQSGQQANADHRFLKDMAQDNEFEIKLSQLVADRAEQQEVKQFAQQMVRDHTQMKQRMQETAQQAGVTLSQGLEEWQQAKLSKMQECSPRELGRKYIFGQVAHHNMAVLENIWASQNLQNDQVKQLAQRSIPRLQEHLQQAEQIARGLVGGREFRTTAGQGQSGSLRHGSDSDSIGGSNRSSGQSGTSGQGASGSSTGGSSGQQNR